MAEMSAAKRRYGGKSEAKADEKRGEAMESPKTQKAEEKSGHEGTPEDRKEDGARGHADRHGGEREEMRKRHEKEHRDLHGQHRDAMRAMHDRQQSDMENMLARHEQEMASQGGNMNPGEGNPEGQLAATPSPSPGGGTAAPPMAA